MKDAEVVVLAVLWGAAEAAVVAAGDLSGKAVWDCTNPLLPDLAGLALGTTDGGEQVARWAPGARVVKAVPPFAELMAAGGRHRTMFELQASRFGGEAEPARDGVELDVLE